MAYVLGRVRDGGVGRARARTQPPPQSADVSSSVVVVEPPRAPARTSRRPSRLCFRPRESCAPRPARRRPGRSPTIAGTRRDNNNYYVYARVSVSVARAFVVYTVYTGRTYQDSFFFPGFFSHPDSLRVRGQSHASDGTHVRPFTYIAGRRRCAAAKETAAARYRAGFPARAHHAAVPGHGHGLRVRVVPATPGRQRRPPSPRGRRRRARQWWWRRPGRGRCSSSRVQPLVVCARGSMHAVRKTEPATRRTRVSRTTYYIL